MKIRNTLEKGMASTLSRFDLQRFICTFIQPDGTRTINDDMMHGMFTGGWSTFTTIQDQLDIIHVIEQLRNLKVGHCIRLFAVLMQKYYLYDVLVLSEEKGYRTNFTVYLARICKQLIQSLSKRHFWVRLIWTDIGNLASLDERNKTLVKITNHSKFTKYMTHCAQSNPCYRFEQQVGEDIIRSIRYISTELSLSDAPSHKLGVPGIYLYETLRTDLINNRGGFQYQTT